MPGRRLVEDATNGPVTSTSTAPVSVAYAGPVASSSTMNAYVAITWASKHAKATVEAADICAICKDWNSPDTDAESEDALVGYDTCGRWFHSYCCADEKDMHVLLSPNPTTPALYFRIMCSVQ